MENSAMVMFQQTIKKMDDEAIFVKPLCDLFNLNYDNQVSNIKNDRILSKSTGKKPDKMFFNDSYPRLYLTKKGFVRWVQIINPNLIDEQLKEKFETYQEMLFDFLYGESLVPNIKRQHEIEIELKEVNKNINKFMIRHKELIFEKKQLSISNYRQLGLEFPDDRPTLENLQTIGQLPSPELNN